MMYKWHAHCKENKDALKFGHYNIFGSLLETERKDGFDYRLLFEGPTVLLKNFVAISLSFSPQIGYEPHDDDYDVSMVGLEGEVETLGRRIGPHSVMYHAAGEPHGMYNPGEMTAKYLVFEFHGHPSVLVRIMKRFASMPTHLRQIQ